MSAVDLFCAPAGRPGAPALLLGSSLGATAEMWDAQVAQLGDRFALNAFDHRGHGRSPVPDGPYTIDDLGADVLRLMDRLELDRAAYCGVSLGGMVGQWLGIHASERIASLVLISTAAHLPPAEGWRERAAITRGAGSPEPVADTVVARWFTPDFAAAHPDVVATHRAMIAGVPAEGYAACCEALAVMDLRDGLPAMTVPTLVITGAQDPSILPEQGRAIAEAVPGARYEELDPGAHLVNVQRSEEVSALIAEHVQAHP
ncbi:MAG TPA: 3-oxoadipate enol-lactonase [Solirubrobacteraceae bacterium]|nr:3-oxoadipate enol-lactonase [Solirubrobacteraceae bacterium]